MRCGGKHARMRFSVILAAAGAGLRLGGNTPKQWLLLAGRPVARWSLEAFLSCGAEEVVVVVNPDGQAEASQAFASLSGWRTVTGGATRSDSVRRGVAALSKPVDAILIHDAARPLVARRHIETLLAGLESAEGAVPALPLTDTIKRAKNGVVTETVPRDDLHRVQTPQAFRADALRAALSDTSRNATDEAALIEADGGRIALVPGDPMLMKLTFPEDFPMAERLIASTRFVRVGHGFDAHRWGPGESVWLCGVEMAHAQTLIGHSDADAGLHALTDAILGAAGLGDIGDHFPPSDVQWKGAASDIFLRHAANLVRECGGEILNVDVTLICELPRIKPHREAMRARIAEILSIAVDRVSVKATTTEGMGFTGRAEGLAAQATATLSCPNADLGPHL